MNTLAVGYVIPAIRAYSGLTPVRQCSCRAYNKEVITNMAITSFYLLNMFPQMRTSSSVNIQHPVPDTQIKHLLLDEHIIITQYSSPNNQAKHVPSDAHFASFGKLLS